MPEIVDILLDEDGNFVVGADGDAVLISNQEVIIQDIKHEIMTFLGGIPWHPEYGGKVQQFLKDEGFVINQKAIANELAAIISKHPNVIAGSASSSLVSWEKDVVELRSVFKYSLETTASQTEASLMVIIDQGGVRVYET